MTPTISHDAASHRIETTVEGAHCTLDYDLDGTTMTITHIKVPDAVGNRGIAAALMQSALETARSRAWRVIPRCPYAQAYLRRHPEWSNIVQSR